MVMKDVLGPDWAEHKFNQQKILAMAGRHDLVVRYYGGLWDFIDPMTNETWVQSLDDERAIDWLTSVPYPRMPGSLETQE